MDRLKIKLCDIQGRLFELSLAAGYESDSFVKAFMTSRLARCLDSEYNRMQWAGEEYLLEELEEEKRDKLQKGNRQYTRDVLYWMGYLYRYWNLYTGESSDKIYRQAPVSVMKRNYMMFHTMDPEMAIGDLKEIYTSKKDRMK